MKIAFISGKGGAGKSTFTRLVGEYFKYHLPKQIGTDLYSEKEVSLLSLATITGVEKGLDVDIFNVTNYEKSLKNYRAHFYIIHIPTNEQNSFDKQLLEQKRLEKISLYDFGADVYGNLKNFENTQEGGEFFGTLDFVFVPVQFDEYSIECASESILRYQSYTNIKFIFCLTEYKNDVSEHFDNFFADKNLMASIHFLQSGNRARIMTVPASEFILQSGKKHLTMEEYIATLSEKEKSLCVDFSAELFQSFDYAFFGFERDTIGTMPWHNSVPMMAVENNFDIDEMKKEIIEAIRSMSNNNQGTTPGDSNIEIELKSLIDKVEQLKSLEKMAQAFVTPNITNIYEEIKNKISGNTKKLMLVTIGAFAAFPFLLFAIIGYFVGSQAKENNAESKAQNEMKYVNEFSKIMVKSGAADAVSIQYSPDGKTASIVCEESGGLCKNRFDANTNTGYIEIIQ